MGKFLSQVDSEASVTPMLDILKEKKKKKKKVKEVEESEYTTYENLQPEEPEELLPKKKKKKKRKHEESWETTNLSMDNQEDVEAENQIMETAVKEKTKKKKKHRLENKVQEENAGFIKPEECEEKMQSEVSLPQTPVTTRITTPKKRPLDQESTSKKKKHRSLDLSNEEMNIEPDEDAGKDEILESQSWMKDDELRLLNNMKAQLPRKDKMSYRRRLKDIDWEKAAFGNFTAGDCRSHFEEILTGIKSVKTLAMVLDEVTENLPELLLKKRKILLPIHRFMRDTLDRSHKKQFTNGGNGFVNLAKAWKNLPEEEKEVYRKPYQEELAEERIRLPSKSSHRNKMRKMCPFDLPRSPLEIWIAEEKKLPNKEAVTYKEWKQKFQNLEKEDKLKHIITSLREFYEYKKSADEYVEKNPDFVFPIIQGPIKSDVQLFLEYRRMPMLPPTRPTMMYYHQLQKAGELDQFSGSEKLVVAMERYKNLPSSRKLHYKSLLDKKMEKYRMQMDAWEENQDELTLFMRARLLGRKIKKTENPKKTAPSASTRRQLLKPSEAFENTIKFEMSIPKFLDEPCKPPKNPFMLFRMKLKHLVQDKCESQSQVSNVCLKEWKNLSKEEKQRYTERCEELKEKYAEQVLQYVKNMNKNLRRLYVGVHRKTLFTFFQRDIFEEVYPNKKYPVYLLSPRKQKTVRKTSEDNFSGEVSDDDFTADSFSGKNNNKNVEFKKNENKSDSLQSKDKLSSDGYVKSKAVEGTSQSDAAKSKSKKGKEISAPTVSMFETKVKYLGTKTLDSFSSDDDQRIQDANVKTFEEESTKTESDSECDIERSQSPYKGSAEASLTTIPNKLESDDCSSSDGYSHTHVMPARKTTKSIRKKV